MSQETVNTIISGAALFVAYTLFHLFNLFRLKVNTTVATNTKDVEQLKDKLDKTEKAFNDYRFDAQYKAGKADTEIEHLRQQLRQLEQHNKELTIALNNERAERSKERAERDAERIAERVRYQNEIDGLKKRIEQLETEKQNFLKITQSKEPVETPALPAPTVEVKP